MKTLQQGAEAIIKLDKNILKNRIKKSYRIPKLDEKIRKSRTKSEAKILEKCQQLNLNTPKLINQDKFSIEIEYIKGDTLSRTLNTYKEKQQLELMQQLGKQTAELHKNNLIHGDLTTSNTIKQDTTNKLFIIDFGLGYHSTKIENKAVDLHLIKQALEAKHYQNHNKLFNQLIKSYQSNYKDASKILEQLKKVELRGRYKH